MPRTSWEKAPLCARYRLENPTDSHSISSDVTRTTRGMLHVLASAISVRIDLQTSPHIQNKDRLVPNEIVNLNVLKNPIEQK